MDLSKIPEYKDHMRLFLAGEYTLAEHYLVTCLTDYILSPSQQSRIYLQLADIIWESGDRARAFACLDKAEVIDSISLQPMLACAKFLVHVGEKDLARHKCEQILDRLRSPDYVHEADDLSIEYYAREAKAILSRL